MRQSKATNVFALIDVIANPGVQGRHSESIKVTNPTACFTGDYHKAAFIIILKNTAVLVIFIYNGEGNEY